MLRCLCLFALLLTLGCSSQVMTGDEALEAAIGKMTEFSFAEPIDTFRAVRNGSTAPEERWQKATYGLAVCLNQVTPVLQANLTEADTLYEELVQKAPESPFAPRALLNRGRLVDLIDYYKDPVDLAKARTFYQEVVTRWGSMPIAGEATLRIAGTYIQTNLDDQVATGISTLTAWLDGHPDDPLAAAMWHYLGDTYFLHQKDYRRSMDAYLQADALGLLWSSRESIVWWRMARMAELHLDEPALAIRYYTRICADAQTSGRAFEAQIALARLGAPIPELSAFNAYPGTRPRLEGEAEVGP